MSVTRTTVQLWEHGSTEPNVSCLPKVFEFLDYDPRPQPSSLGQKLRQYRERRGLTQEALAARLHVAPVTLAKWEAGYLPTAEHLARIKSLLEPDRSKT